MDFSNMFRPALNRITSSLASTNNSYGGFITRMLSFTSSFNDRTSLLQEHDAELGPTHTDQEAGAAPPPPPPPPATTEAAAPAAAPATTAADHPFDIESGTTLLAPTATGAAGREEPATTTEGDAESKRVGKSVQTVCLFAASSSLVLFVNLTSNKQQPGAAAAPAPASASGQHGGGGGGSAAALLYGADMAFISLGFFSSLGLSMFSIVAARPGKAKVARVQKWGMVVAVASVVVAFSLRVCMTAVA